MSDWRTEIRGLSYRVPKDTADHTKLVAALESGESDRGCALIAASMVESALEVALRTRLVVNGKAAVDSIFGYEGPLGRFSSKIKLAYAFGTIDSDIKNDLDRIREIRNAFAHTKVSIDFSTPEIKRVCLPLGDAALKISKLQASDFDGTRGIFICSAVILLTLADVAAANGPTSGTRPATYADIASWIQRSRE